MSKARASLLLDIERKFALATPFFTQTSPSDVVLEKKPYLQPFEDELSKLELTALLHGSKVSSSSEQFTVLQNCSNELELRKRLTYWQRVGRSELLPTLQVALELTQRGRKDIAKRELLHRARRLRYGTHGIHEYRGKFFPQLVRSLITIARVPRGGLVIDPMVGSGTTVCEANASGFEGIGGDLNPLSALIATVKAELLHVDAKRFHATVAKYLASLTHAPCDPAAVWDANDCAYLARWFDPAALRDIAGLVGEIARIRSAIYRRFMQVCLSNIIRELSWQKDTDLRVRKEVSEYAEGSAKRRFREEVHSQLEQIEPYLAVLSREAHGCKSTIRLGTATSIDKLFPEHAAQCDVLITSPPYATALPYIDTDRLSLIVLKLLPRSAHSETEWQMIGTREVTETERKKWWTDYQLRCSELPTSIQLLIEKIAHVNHKPGVGFRRRNLPSLLGKYFLDMADAMASARRMMRSGADGFYVVGNNSTVVDGDKVDIPTDKLLFELGAHVGWQQVDFKPMELLHSRDIFRDNRGSSEAILHFKAP